MASYYTSYLFSRKLYTILSTWFSNFYFNLYRNLPKTCNSVILVQLIIFLYLRMLFLHVCIAIYSSKTVPICLCPCISEMYVSVPFYYIGDISPLSAPFLVPLEFPHSQSKPC